MKLHFSPFILPNQLEGISEVTYCWEVEADSAQTELKEAKPPCDSLPGASVHLSVATYYCTIIVQSFAMRR